MPLLKGASSEHTTFIKYNAMTLAAPASPSRTAVAVPNLSIVGSFIRATRAGSRSSPRTSILQTYNNILAAAAAAPGGGGGSEAATGPFYLPTSVDSDAFIVKYSLSGVVQWETTISGTGYDEAVNITADSTGVYVIGKYNSTAGIVLVPGVALPITAGINPTAPRGLDAYIVNYNTSGVAQWATTIPGTEFFDVGYGITLDSTGVYAIGNYSSTSQVTLNNEKVLPISQSYDAFIVKYNTSGLAQWATTIGGIASDNGYAISADSTGVYVTGSYTSSGALTLAGGVVTLPSSVSQDAFIVKYNTSGVAQWANTIRGSGSDGLSGLATDSTGVYVTGQYRSTSAITLAAGVVLPSNIAPDAFIVKYSTSGTPLWATTFPVNSYASGAAIATDLTGVYVSGVYNSSSIVTLSNGKQLPVSAGVGDAFIVKYDASNGNALWATTIQGIGNDIANSIITNSSGVYVTGAYNSTSVITLPGGTVTLPITARASPSAATGSDVFIVKYDTSGVAQWATTIRGTGGDSGLGIAADSTSIYVSGNYTSSDQILLTNGS